ncbi:MAG: aldo/keto reductase [Myxococcales bacterium]|nr:aldo/keto reductase [Myxococcota bacterium]MDW8281219.1 aldo/keto reductase [Myxococcales bacterium]
MRLATPASTAAYAARYPNLPGHFRLLDGLTVSSLGLGTYLGQSTEQDDVRCRNAVLTCLQAGVNLIDTAINYRAQRAERSIGEALLQLHRLGMERQEVVLCTKAGYLPFDGTVPRDAEAYLRRTYIDSGLVPREAIVGGCHCLHPDYLRDQLQRSLRNARIAAWDVFYLHNPETQLDEVSRQEFERRMVAAFALCEQLCSEGLIGRYGCATWSGLLRPPTEQGHLSLERLCALAREAGGAGHRFRVVQLPLSLALDEALFRPTQRVGLKERTVLQAAAELGLSVICSGPLLQGKVLRRPLPERLRRPFVGLRRDSQRALQFVRSAPGVVAVLCGMKDPAHLQENLEILATAPLGPEEFVAAFGPLP